MEHLRLVEADLVGDLVEGFPRLQLFRRHGNAESAETPGKLVELLFRLEGRATEIVQNFRVRLEVFEVGMILRRCRCRGLQFGRATGGGFRKSGFAWR